MNDRLQLLENLMDSLKDPFLFVDTEHVIRYMNRTAIDHYKDGPAEIDRSIFDCHNEKSKQIIIDVFESFKNGVEEKIITDNEKYRIFMRAVRDQEGKLIGYYERYEPPAK
jgi:DUF438 domain-containing protein